MIILKKILKIPPIKLQKIMKVQDNKLFFFRVYKDKKSRADILTDRVSEMDCEEKFRY